MRSGNVLTRRRVIAVAVQLLSSLSNVVPLVMASRVSSEAVETFAIFFSFFLIATGLNRAIYGEAELVSAGEPGGIRLGVLIGSTALGFLAATCCAIVNVVFQMADPRIWWLGFMVLPVAAVNNSVRLALYRDDALARLFASDAAWTLGSIGILPLAIFTRASDIGPVLCWSVGLVFATAVCCRGLRLVVNDYNPRPQFSLAGPYLAEFGLSRLLVQLNSVALALIAGPSSLAAYRLAEAPFGVLRTAGTGVATLLVRDGASAARENSGELTRHRSQADRILAVATVVSIGIAAVGLTLLTVVPGLLSEQSQQVRRLLFFGLPDRIYGCNWFYEGQFTLLARRNVRSFRAVASAERCSVCVA